jgi:hypothetical protein
MAARKLMKAKSKKRGIDVWVNLSEEENLQIIANSGEYLSAELVDQIELKDWPFGNIYLELVRENKLDLDDMKEWIKAGRPSDNVWYERANYTTRLVNKTKLRIEYTTQFSFAIPCERAIETCRKYLPIIEIGAGSGYWARMITEAWESKDYLAYDNFTTHAFPRLYYNVLDAEPIYNGETLFFCWPYMNSMAADWMKRCSPKRVIYVGEGNGGCTADDEFHELIEKHYKEIESVSIPQYESIHDCLKVYELRNSRTDP